VPKSIVDQVFGRRSPICITHVHVLLDQDKFQLREKAWDREHGPYAPFAVDEDRIDLGANVLLDLMREAIMVREALMMREAIMMREPMCSST
jgi:hypothetical protein